MGFLRRFLGGDRSEQEPSSPPANPAEADAAEAAYELELLREDQERTSELVRRQQRYADYSWTPPSEGGERRADDDDKRPDEGGASEG